MPPREWEENGKQWRQKVSNQPATRMDVIKLTEMLDMSLQHLQARETGICPIRRALYSQCFDEIIRQVVIVIVYLTYNFVPRIYEQKIFFRLLLTVQNVDFYY